VKDSNVNSGSNQAGSTSTGLLAQLRAQEREAWIRLAKLYGPLVYSWCRRRGLQAEDTADVMQEVFRALAGGIHDFKAGPTGSFRGWLWTITRNKILDHHRRSQRQPEAVGGSDAQQRWLQIPESLDESEAGSGKSGSLVSRALALIRPDFTEASWQAFWRVVMEDQSVADVARSLGISINAIYIAKSRVLRRLRDELGEDCV
jgi:RNA polymerase sigma-70 factor (ECF subfamily)